MIDAHFQKYPVKKDGWLGIEHFRFIASHVADGRPNSYNVISKKLFSSFVAPRWVYMENKIPETESTAVLRLAVDNRNLHAYAGRRSLITPPAPRLATSSRQAIPIDPSPFRVDAESHYRQYAKTRDVIEKIALHRHLSDTVIDAASFVMFVETDLPNLVIGSISAHHRVLAQRFAEFITTPVL